MSDSRARRRNWLVGHKPPDETPSDFGSGDQRKLLTNFNMSLGPLQQNGQRRLNAARQPISCPLKFATRRVEHCQLQDTHSQVDLDKTIWRRRLARKVALSQVQNGPQSSGYQAKRCLIIMLMAALTMANFCLCLSGSIDNNNQNAHPATNNNPIGENGTTTGGRQLDLMTKVVPCEQASSKPKVMSASERLVSGQPMETVISANNNSLDHTRSMANVRDGGTTLTTPRSVFLPKPASNIVNKLARANQLDQLGAQSTQMVASTVSRDLELFPAAGGDKLEPLVTADSKKKKKMMKKKKKMEKKHKEWKKGKKHKKKKYESKKKKGGSSKKKKGKKEKKKWGMEKKGHKKKGNFKKKKWGHKKKMKKGHKKGKKGHKMLKDKGHKKKGFKKVYHKEEWGKKKKWHDIKREKKWHSKDKKWKKKWAQEKGKKYKGKHMKKYEKKNKHGKKYKKEKKEKYKKHKGEKFKKGHKKKKEEYSKKKEGGKKKKMKKEMKKMKKKKG